MMKQNLKIWFSYLQGQQSMGYDLPKVQWLEELVHVLALALRKAFDGTAESILCMFVTYLPR